MCSFWEMVALRKLAQLDWILHLLPSFESRRAVKSPHAICHLPSGDMDDYWLDANIQIAGENEL